MTPALSNGNKVCALRLQRSFPNPRKRKAEQEEILEKLRNFVQRSWKAVHTLYWLPTAPNLPGERCLQLEKQMPSFSLTQQLLLSAITNKYSSRFTSPVYLAIRTQQTFGSSTVKLNKAIIYRKPCLEYKL